MHIDKNSQQDGFDGNDRPSTSKDEIKKSPSLWRQAKDAFVE